MFFLTQRERRNRTYSKGFPCPGSFHPAMPWGPLPALLVELPASCGNHRFADTCNRLGSNCSLSNGFLEPRSRSLVSGGCGKLCESPQVPPKWTTNYWKLGAKSATEHNTFNGCLQTKNCKVGGFPLSHGGVTKLQELNDGSPCYQWVWLFPDYLP